jgi:hypothetical protein
VAERGVLSADSTGLESVVVMAPVEICCVLNERLGMLVEVMVSSEGGLGCACFHEGRWKGGKESSKAAAGRRYLTAGRAECLFRVDTGNTAARLSGRLKIWAGA